MYLLKLRQGLVLFLIAFFGSTYSKCFPQPIAFTFHPVWWHLHPCSCDSADLFILMRCVCSIVDYIKVALFFLSVSLSFSQLFISLHVNNSASVLVDICTSCGVSYQRNIKWCLPLMKACALSGRLQHMLLCVESQRRETAADMIIILLVTKTQLPGILSDVIHTQQEEQRVSMSKTHAQQSLLLKLRQALMNSGCNGEIANILVHLPHAMVYFTASKIPDTQQGFRILYESAWTCFMKLVVAVICNGTIKICPKLISSNLIIHMNSMFHFALWVN